MLEGDITTPYITSTIQTVNARLAPLDYEIRSMRDQVSKNLTYALVNTTSDAMVQLATTFSPDAISYIKRLLDEMFERNNTRNREIMAVASIKAKDLAKAPRQQQSQIQGDDEDDEAAIQAVPRDNGLKISEAESVLAQLVEQSFLQKSRNGYYSLAPRSLMELRSYLKETYNEPADPEDPGYEPVIRIRDCEGCREIVTVGQRCPHRDCGVRLHDGCAQQYFRARRGNKECPSCRTEWSGNHFVGEKAVQNRSNGAARGAAGTSRVSGGRSQVFDDDEEDE
jgi:hypothetical protein